MSGKKDLTKQRQQGLALSHWAKLCASRGCNLGGFSRTVRVCSKLRKEIGFTQGGEKLKKGHNLIFLRKSRLNIRVSFRRVPRGLCLLEVMSGIYPNKISECCLLHSQKLRVTRVECLSLSLSLSRAVEEGTRSLVSPRTRARSVGRQRLTGNRAPPIRSH